MKTIGFADVKGGSWLSLLLLVLGLWLGGSLAVDCLVMPGLYTAGMMTQPDFAAVGAIMFGWLNHAELLMAAGVLTGVLALAQGSLSRRQRRAIALAAVLMAIPLLYTYFLTPAMTALGAQLDLFGDRPPLPAPMTWLHGSYWGLELLKLAAGFSLFRLLDQQHNIDIA